jgi:DNA-binding Lrp family transcriptional regulator
MAIKIEKKITGYNVVTEEDKAKAVEAEKQEAQRSAEIVQLGEPLSRPEKLVGNTYKIKTPVTEHALYITINDVVMNEGTPQEHRRPFEIFINSKNMDHFQWIVALTRVMSAVFRKGGDVTFLVEELHSVAGEYDFLAKIRTTHARALEDVIYQIKAIEGVARTTSTVVLNTEFEDRPLNLGWLNAGKAP